MASNFGRRNARGALHLEQGGTGEELERDLGRDRVPGQAEDQGVAVRAENEGRSRLHANRGDVESDAEFAEGRLHEIEVARGHAAGKNDGVMAFVRALVRWRPGSSPDRRDTTPDVRRHSPGLPDRGQRGPDHWRCESARRSGASLGSTTSSPVTITATRGRRETTGSISPTEASTARWAAPMRTPGRRSRARSPPPSRGARCSDPRSDDSSRPRTSRGSRHRRALDLDHGVGSFGDRGAGHDPHGLARSPTARSGQTPARISPTTLSLAPLDAHVGRSHREAVHGRAVERGQIAIRDNRRRAGSATPTSARGIGLRAQRRNASQNRGLRLVDCDHSKVNRTLSLRSRTGAVAAR